MRALLSIEEAQRRVLERVEPLEEEGVPLENAGGRVVSAAVRARVDLPPFPSSAMDGFAVRAGDTPGCLPVVGRVAAGRPSRRDLRAGEAMAIATGGVVPEGANAVVPVEYVVATDNEIEVAETFPAGANVRPRGGDVGAGDVVVGAGTRLGPAQLGAIAAAGVPEVACSRRPRAALLTTGSELRRPGEPLRPGEIYDANGLILAEQLAAAGAVVERLAPVPDDEDSHRAAIERGLELDLLVTSGGVSVGPHDLVRRIAAELGVAEVFWGVAVRPGKPVSFGVRGRTLVFGLPGNPVSSLVTFELFVRPAVVALQGLADPLPRFLVGRLVSAGRRNPRRAELARARAIRGEDGVVLDLVVGQESHMIVRAAEADALVLLPEGDGELPAGTPVRYLPLS